MQQLRILNTKKRGKSSAKQNEDEQLEAQTEQLKEEVKVLKNNKITETTKNTDTFTLTETLKQNSKNVQMASDSQGGQQQNMEIIQVIGFIEETMQNLKTFGKIFKVQLDSNLTQ